MRIKDFVKWNTRASVVYAVGVWTTIGYFGYMKYTGKYDQLLQKEEEEEVEQDENKVVYVTPHTKTVVIYKKDFVPLTTQIYNFLQPSSTEPPKTESNTELVDDANNTSSRF